MNRGRMKYAGVIACLLAANACGAADDVVDKSGYWLFNPVPDDQMREFSTDRPGKTHSSTTVDAGHWQLESDFVNTTYDRYSDHEQATRSYSLGTPLIKAGITDWADLEVGLALFNDVESKDLASNTSAHASGFGDVLLGSKINLFGNDGGNQSMAVLPFVKLPTASNGVGNGVTEYTLNIPYTITLNDPWSLTLEPAFGLLKNYNDDGHHGDASFLVNINRTIFTKTITAALEFASELSADHNIGNQYTLDPSLQWVVSPGVQLDVGVYLGLNRAAPDYNPYTGISFRF